MQIDAGRSGRDWEGRWRPIRDALTARPDELGPVDLDLLADAHFWLDQVDESIAVRRMAYRAHVAAGDGHGAALAAWRLFYDHFLVGEDVVANGWIERCGSHVAEAPDTLAAGWLALALIDVAARRGDEEEALRQARTAMAIARAGDDPNLVAMALQAEGRAEIRSGRKDRGVRRLDEAMVAVINDELDPLYTGWVYCNVVSTCFQLADLARAGQWSEAALRWCESLDVGRMYPGLCRVYAADLACLRGAWATAEIEAERACVDLTVFDPRYAGEAFYLVGELRRLRGDLGGATAAYERASELGRGPQPGLALVLAARGRIADAVTMLQTALPGAGPGPLGRARFLSELTALEAATGASEAVANRAAELEALADACGAPVVRALAIGAQGRLAALEGRPDDACHLLVQASAQLGSLGAPYEAARLRVAVSRAAAARGDRETAKLEARSAWAAFDQLGAATDLASTGEWIDALGVGFSTPASPVPAQRRSAGVAGAGPLSAREVEILRLVAAGSTNRAIASELHLSPHTVGRHLSNIFTKLGVSTRAAATAYAYEHGLVGPSAEP